MAMASKLVATAGLRMEMLKMLLKVLFIVHLLACLTRGCPTEYRLKAQVGVSGVRKDAKSRLFGFSTKLNIWMQSGGYNEVSCGSLSNSAL